MWGDKWTNILNISSCLITALITASLFYDQPDNSHSIFTRPGALFFPILLFGLNALAEVQASFLGRPIVSRQKSFAFARPSAYAVASTLLDIPLIILTLSLFQIVFYFMVHFQFDAGKFFSMWVILLATFLSFTSLFRMIGAWCKHFGLASQIAGWTIMVMMVYAGKLAAK